MNFRKIVLGFGWMLIASSVMIPAVHAEIIVDFEELSTFTGFTGNSDGQPGGNFYNGNAGSGNSNSSGWNSNGVHFSNNYSSDFGGFWSGWSYSTVVNSITPGFGNQYASYPGGGSNDLGGVEVGGTYAVAYTGSVVNETDAIVTFASATRVMSLDVANTTWLYRYAKDNAPPFYGDRSNLIDGDYVRLRIDGVNASDQVIGSVTKSLVDFAGAGAADDYALEGWEQLSLVDLGDVYGLRFIVESNVTSTFGSTTYLDPPAYFAIDNMRLSAVPEPTAWGLLACGVFGLMARRARRQHAL